MRGVDLAIYADALAGEAASLAARAERARSRLRQAAIEKRARTELTAVAVERLESHRRARRRRRARARKELRELEAALDAVEELQSWVEGELQRGVRPTSRPPSSS